MLLIVATILLSCIPRVIRNRDATFVPSKTSFALFRNLKVESKLPDSKKSDRLSIINATQFPLEDPIALLTVSSIIAKSL